MEVLADIAYSNSPHPDHHTLPSSAVRRTPGGPPSLPRSGAPPYERCFKVLEWLIALRARASLVPNLGPGLWLGSKPGPKRTRKGSGQICPAPECGKEFEFDSGEIRVFEARLPLFERHHFCRSELSRYDRASSGRRFLR